MAASHSCKATGFVGLSPLALSLGATGVSVGSASGQIQLERWLDFQSERVIREYVTADLNGDELNDVALLDGNLWVYFNNGDGTFEQVDLGIDVWLGHGLNAEDLDRIGTIDLVWANNSPSLFVYYNDGTGRNGELREFPIDGHGLNNLVVADLEGDGYADVVGSAEEGWHVGTATIYVIANRFGEFEETQAISAGVSDLLACRAGDFDGDGDADVAALTADWYDYFGYLKLDFAQISVLTNTGAGELELSHSIRLPYGQGRDEAPMGLATGDMDGDSDLDLVISTYYDDPEVRILENLGNAGSFIVHPAIPIGSWPPSHSWVSVRDLDGDGRLDIVFSSAPNETYWTLQNDGALTFTATEYPLNRPAAGLPHLADLTRDGRYDLLVGEYFGIEFVRNISPLSGPYLEHGPLHRGQLVDLVVTEAEPGEKVYFLCSLQGTGNSLGIEELGGLTLDLQSPIRTVTSVRADENGTARTRVRVPSSALLRSIGLQAVIRRGPEGQESVKTPFDEARIRE